MKGLLFFLFFFVAIQGAQAHPLNVGLMEITQERNRYEFQLKIHAEDFPAITAHGSFFAETLEKIVVIPRIACRWTQSQELRDETLVNVVIITATLECVELTPTLDLELVFLERMPASFNLLTRFRAGDDEKAFSNSSTSTRLQVSGGTATRGSFMDFFKLGAAHVGLSHHEWIEDGKLKIPEGVDHLLFLLTLILASTGLVSTIKLVTGFTVGHSLSVGLSMAGFKLLPPPVVEPIIALTIALMALDFLITISPTKKWLLVLVVGFIHGFAFATAIDDAHLSGSAFVSTLTGFNLGIEFAQVSFIALALLVGRGLKSCGLPLGKATRPASVMIALIGLYWFIERIL